MQLSLVLGQQDTQVHLNPKLSVLTVQQDIRFILTTQLYQRTTRYLGSPPAQPSTRTKLEVLETGPSLTILRSIYLICVFCLSLTS